MKKLKTTLLLSSILFMAGRNCFAETGEETVFKVTIPTKYAIMAVAVIVIILLLFLGYKMDSDDNKMSRPKKRKEKEKPIDFAETKGVAYEPDSIKYEEDKNINTSDLSEPIEYDDTNDANIFSNENNNLNIPNIQENFDTTKTEEVKPDENSDYGEDFDTSIIDDLDDDEDLKVDESAETKKDEEEKKLEEEIDNLDYDDELNKETDPLMDELKNIKMDEPTHGGFSNSSDIEPKVEVKEEPKKKKTKKFTKVKKATGSNDFLDQMESTLIKDKEARDSKKKSK